MMNPLKSALLEIWIVERAIRLHIRVSKWCWKRVPIVGPYVSMLLDRVLLFFYGIDLLSSSIEVKALSISHPVGVLLGGNGIFSPGRVAVMAGVKFVARTPTDPEYLRRHEERRVFVFGDNVVIGANSVVVGPLEICDNVTVAAMSLVNRSISEPGIYAGAPVRKVADLAPDHWVSHL
jgi:acetyltransferase-like isoleucine patch superfamily enzyme